MTDDDKWVQTAILAGYECGMYHGRIEGFAACRELAAKAADEFSEPDADLQKLLADCEDDRYSRICTSRDIATSIRALIPESGS